MNNALLAANLSLADDAFTLGALLGIPPEALAQVLGRGTGCSYALNVALRARDSVEIRSVLLPFLKKDVQSLTRGEAASECAVAAPMLADAASEAVRRLSDPPSGWTP